MPALTHTVGAEATPPSLQGLPVTSCVRHAGQVRDMTRTRHPPGGQRSFEARTEQQAHTSWCRPVARGGVRRSVLKVAVVVVFRRSSESSTVEVHPLVITCGSLPSTTDSGTRADQMLYARQRHRLTTSYAALRPLPGQ